MPRIHSLILLFVLGVSPAFATWTSLATGLDYQELKACQVSDHDDSRITVVRMVSRSCTLRILTAAKDNGGTGISAIDWAQKFNLNVVTNAGMFNGDQSTHTGFLKVSEAHVNNRNDTKAYKSFLVFGAKSGTFPDPAIVDLEQGSLVSLRDKYRTVIQNLRLIKKPGTNVWAPSTKRWSEAALAQDKDGNLLFVFSRSPYSMQALNTCLLKLPLGIVAAQHLEGGPEASLILRTKVKALSLVGSYETGFNDGVNSPYVNNDFTYSLPNVLGVVCNH